MPRKQARKNPNGMGSTRWNVKRQRYEHRVTVGYDDDGKQIRRMATGKTPDELAAKIKALTETVAIDPAAPVGMTVAQWFHIWFTDILPLEPSGRTHKEHYMMRARLYVLPYVGAVPLTELTQAHIRKMLTALRNKGLSGSTQTAAYKTLYRALNLAMREGYVTRNVATMVDAPALNAKKGRTLTFEESKRLLAYLRDDDNEPIIVTLLTTGMRPGELGGLTWEDVDLDAGRLWIRRTLHKATNGNPCYVTDDVAKTDRSIRGIPLAPYAVEILRRHRTNQKAQRFAFGPGWGNDHRDHDFVFTREDGSPIRHDTLRKQIRRATNECGLGEWNPYDMRHSAISLMAMMGYNSKMISEIAGNSPRIAEAVYMHTLEAAKVDAVNAFSAAITP